MFDREYAAQALNAARNSVITIREQLKGEIHTLEAAVARKKEMLKLLDEYPVIEKFMDLSRS